MKIKSFFIFLIIGTTIAFAGLPIKETINAASPNPTENRQVMQALDNVIVLVNLLSILGVATFILIRVLEVVTKLDLMKPLLLRYNENPRTVYVY